jgi:hypothetical protein
MKGRTGTIRFTSSRGFVKIDDKGLKILIKKAITNIPVKRILTDGTYM